MNVPYSAENGVARSREEFQAGSNEMMTLAMAIDIAGILAHPGHGAIPAESPAHYIFEPVHSVWVVLAAAMAGGAFYALRSWSRRRAEARNASPKR